MQLTGTTFVLAAALRAAANPVTITSVLTLHPVPETVFHYTNTTYTPKRTGTATSAGRSSNATLQRTLPYHTTHIVSTITTTMPLPSSLVTPSPNATVEDPTSWATSSFDPTDMDPTTMMSAETVNASATSTPAACTPNGIHWNSPSSFSLCAPSHSGPPRYVDMGAVAAGTLCHDGVIMRATDGTCTPDGNLTCADSGMKFFLCYEGGLVDMGSVAPGTTCEDGQIMAT